MNNKDIIFSICLFLDIKHIICLSRVNKFINYVSNDEYLWKLKCQEAIGKNMELFQKLYTNESNKSLMKRYNSINKLLIKFNHVYSWL